MTTYDRDVREKLGDDAWNLLIKSVNEGQILSQHSGTILPGFWQIRSKAQRSLAHIGTEWRTVAGVGVI